MGTTEYTQESIRSRKGADRVRLSPAMYLGSNKLNGAQHTVYEIVGNITDEAISGFGDEADFYLYDDGSFAFRDYGRGVPLDWNKVEQNWNYILVYEELHAGGKYENNQDILKKIDEEGKWASFKLSDYPYMISIGMNGVGAAATQYTSEFFTVISYRDGKESLMMYEKGVHILDELEVSPLKDGTPTGTFIHYKPDSEVFTDVNIPVKWFEKLCQSLSYTAGLTVRLHYADGKVKTYEKTDIFTVMEETTGNCISAHAFVHVVDDVGDICICDTSIAIGPAGKGNEYYHNSIPVSGGSHANGVSSAMFRFFTDIAKKEGIKLKESDYSSVLSFMVLTLSNKLSPRGQTKDSIDDTYVTISIADAADSALKEAYAKGESWVMEVIESVIQNAQNRMALAEMSKSLKQIEKSTKNLKMSDKFIPCKKYDEKDYNGIEVFITEGDSAGGRAITARDGDFQCILQIRGKSLNLYKAPLEKLLANKEIQDFIAACGCGVELDIDDYKSFDISKLRFSKIILMPDADVDGGHIAMLEFLKIFKLCPELLYQGYVYLAITPLYCITRKDGVQVYCMDQEELERKRKEIGEFNIEAVDRFKGHGESSAEGLWSTSMNPETRTLMQLKVDRSDTSLYETLEVLFGKSTDLRKRAILGELMNVDYDETMENIENISEYIDELDLSMVEVEEVEY